MVYVTGDTHGSIARIRNFCNNNDTTTDDIIIILGDAGFNYYLNEKDDWLKDKASELPITIFCIRGNHECRPENLGGYITKEFHGDIVYYQKEYPNLLFAKDGGIYNLADKRCLTIGGAYSVDKQYRVARGWMWFADEQLFDHEMKEIDSYIYKDPKYDYVFTHTCPYKTRPKHLFLPQIDQSTVDNSMEHWLDTIDDKITYDKWYFGHFHDDWENDRFHMLLNSIVVLGA